MTTVPYVPSPDRSESPWGVFRRLSTPDIEYRALARTMDLTLWKQIFVRAYNEDSANAGVAGAGAYYQIVDAEPAHEGKFQDGNNRWYEIMPDEGGYIHPAWFGDDIDGVRLAQAVSKRLKLTPGYFYELPTTGGTVITGTDEEVEVDFEDSAIAMTQGCVAFISIAGTYEETFTVTSIASNVLTLSGADTGVLAKGKLIRMGDLLTPHWWSQSSTRRGAYDGSRRAGEFGVVGSVSGNTVTLRATPKWATDRTPEYGREILRTPVSGVTNNGGAIRVAFSQPHFGTTGLNYTFENIGGVPNANVTCPVVVVDSTTLELVGPVFGGAYTSGGTGRKSLTYSTHATAGMQIGSMRDNSCNIRIGKIMCAASVTSAASRLIKVSARYVDIKAGYVEKSTGIIFSLIACFGRIEYYGASTAVQGKNTGYILTNAGSTLDVHLLGSRTTRHAIDGGQASSGDGTTGLAACGAAAHTNVYVFGGNMGSTEVAHATHAGTDSWTFYWPKARHSASNVVVRGINHTVVDARSFGTGSTDGDDEGTDTGPDGGGAFASFCQFAVGVISAADNGSGLIRLSVDGHTGRGPELATGMRVSVGGATGAAAASTNGLRFITVIDTVSNVTRIDLQGSTFSSSSGAGDAVVDAFLDAADGFTMVDAQMDDNPTTMYNGRNNGGYATVDGGTWRGTGNPSHPISIGRGFTIENNRTKFSGSPTDGIVWASAFTEFFEASHWTVDGDGTLPPLFDISTRPQAVKVLMRNVEVNNPNGALASLFRRNVGDFLPAAGSRFGNIRVHGACTTLISGLSMTASIAAMAAFCDGPIWINKQLILGPPRGTDVDVTQLTSKSTTVASDSLQGNITMNAAALAAGDLVSFTFTNAFITAASRLRIRHAFGGTLGRYHVDAECAAGSATISVMQLSGGSLSEAIGLRYNVDY